MEISEAYESWNNSSRSWWHRHHGQNCDGTAYNDLGQPSYGLAGAAGVRCSWQGIGKPPQLRSTMPLQDTPGFRKKGAHSQYQCTKRIRYRPTWAPCVASIGGQRGFVKRSVIQALADVTGRGWVKRSRDRQEQNDNARVVRETRRLQSDWLAEKRMIQRQNINSRTEPHADGDGERAVHQSTGEEAKNRSSCRTCDAIQAVTGMASVPGEEVPWLNAALL